MKPSVMCVTKEAITDSFSLNNLPNEHIHFMNREVVDKIPEVGKMFPQIIPVIAVKKDNKYLTYARNGTEGRLHGKRSMTVGGHIDITDTIGSRYYDYRSTIALAAMRELFEETGLNKTFTYDEFTEIIWIPDGDEVSQVHIGLVSIVETNKTITPNEELADVQWLTKEELIRDISNYELWSQHLIQTLK